MLRFLSKQQRARNAFLIFFCFVMAVTLVIFLGMPIGDWISSAFKGSEADAADPKATVAEVDGDKIPARELQQALNRIAQGGSGQNMAFIKSFSDTLLDQLITQRIVKAEAARLGITVSDDEVRREIARQVPNFIDDKGRFIDFDRYRRSIEASGSTVEEFEQSIRQSLLDKKLQAYLTAGITVTPREVEEDFVRQNTSVNLSYVVIEPKKYEAEVSVSEAEAKSYFDQHKDEFKITEVERKVDYIYIAYDALKPSVSVTEDEIKQEYEFTKSQQTIGATVSQIVFPFNETNEAQVRQKADEVVKKARGDEKTPAEDFAKLGGKSIGYVKKDSKDTSYKQRVFTLVDAKKDVTEPIKEGNAFYVMKVTRWDRKSLAQARPELLQQLRDRKARTEASKLATEITKKLQEVKDIRKVAEEFRSRLGNLPLDQIVKQTGFFATSTQLPEFDIYSSSFTSSASNLNDIGQVGNQITLKDGIAIPQLAAKRDPHEPSFEEVKDRVIEKLRKQKAAERARQRANELAQQVNSVQALQKAAAAEKLELKTQDDFKRGSILQELEQSDQLEGFAFSVEVGKTAPQAIKVGEKYVLLGVTAKKAADLTKLAEEQDATRKRLLDQRRNQLYQAYLKQIKDKLASEGKIIVYQKVFDTIAAGAGGDIRDILNINPAP
ncbi:MAG: SurA N-terminal domain-containing protein [Acidobacteriota bacterium]|nr:SurA N-terminal domain-containing protein [Blastocatellia bacterium]MDW8240154.1 SurA N-terminal domain-containing protein [Acidobacteriota bacterium]